MTRIRVDETLRKKFCDFVDIVEICDEDGFVIARVSPVVDPANIEPNEPRVSDEELERRANSTEWYTTEQVLAHLKKLEEEEKR